MLSFLFPTFGYPSHLYRARELTRIVVNPVIEEALRFSAHDLKLIDELTPQLNQASGALIAIQLLIRGLSGGDWMYWIYFVNQNDTWGSVMKVYKRNPLVITTSK